MANYGFSSAIPYGTDMFEVTGVELCEWEDALENAGDDSIAREWVTYDFLINNGYFVSAPSDVRPTAGGDKKTGTESQKSSSKTGRVVLTPEVVASPGIRGVPDDYNLIEGKTREPIWTQARILSEREKLLRERERIFELKRKSLNEKIINHMESVKRLRKSNPEDAVNRIIGTAVILFVIWWFFIR